MARMFPKLDVNEIENQGERRLAAALAEQLPARVEIYHSFCWLQRNGKGPIIEGECDFVLLDPQRGLLFVEVKGGALEYDPAEQLWRRILSSGEVCLLNKDPFAQVQRNMYEIVNRIGKSLLKKDGALPFTYGYAVAFPDSRYQGILPASIRPELILDADRCGQAAGAIDEVFTAFARNGHEPLNATHVQAIHDVLLPRYAIMPVLWRRVEDQEARLKRLTDDQLRLLDLLDNHREAAIEGVAGSGKSMLALAKAQQCARQGMRTLLLCYNRLLKEWLQSAIPESFADTLVIDTYHGLIHTLCQKAGIAFEPDRNRGNMPYWNDEAPELLMQACEILGPQEHFEAVVVDEGQDFHELWWASIEALFRDPDHKGCYYVFYDPRQNLYVKSPAIPAQLGAPFTLRHNCRNTARIASHCSALIGDHDMDFTLAPLGDEPELVLADDWETAMREASKCVRYWCVDKDTKLNWASVAVLAPAACESQWPDDFKTLPLTRDFDSWRRNEGVLITTPGRFKGLEADAIVIIEKPRHDHTHEQINRYVARTRAKHLLKVIEMGRKTE